MGRKPSKPMDAEMFIEKVKSDLVSAWRDGDRVTIPMKDILECEAVSLEAGFEVIPVLRLDIPLVVDEDGFRFSINKKAKGNKV